MTKTTTARETMERARYLRDRAATRARIDRALSGEPRPFKTRPLTRVQLAARM